MAEPIWEVMWMLDIGFAAHYLPHLAKAYLENCRNAREHIEALIADAHTLSTINGEPSENAYSRCFISITNLEKEGFRV